MRKAKEKLPKFAKHHYEVIAQRIQTLVLSQKELSQDELDELIELRHSIIGDFVDIFEKDNPKFDRDRFIRACQPGANVRARKHSGTVNSKALLRNEWRA